MKTERARELYSDYAEGVLSPALAQALEQHFASEPDARADYDQFTFAMRALDSAMPEVEPPLGFRAKVLELAAAEQARLEALPSRRASLSLAAWFASLNPTRRLTSGALAALVVVALAGVLIHQVASPTSNGGFVGPFVGTSVPTIIRAVTVMPAGVSGTSHLFHIHLPSNVSEANVMAYVVTATDQITDPDARSRDAMPALKQPQTLTNDEEMQIPVTLVNPPAPGATLDLLVQWTPTDTRQTSGEQVVFAPLLPATSAQGNAPTSGSFYETLQVIAARYDVTVIADATASPTNTVSTEPADSTALQALKDAAKQVGYQVAPLSNNTYQVYPQ